ncbi:MAG: hypothetical protein QM758_20765 [Armatimonas sp.]
MDSELVVISAEVAGAERAYPLRFQLFLVLLTTLALFMALILLPLFSLTFWFLFEVVRQKLGMSAAVPALWPLIAATIAAWSFVYLMHDRIGALGNARAESLTLERAVFLLGTSLPEDRTFVELRLKGYPSDIGWLFFYEDRLHFVGDVLQAKLPRQVMQGPIHCSPTLGGLLSAYVDAPPLRLMAREDMERLSDARRMAPELAERLRRWLDSTPNE